MATIENTTNAKAPLRALTDEEMRSGIDAAAWHALAQQAEQIHRSRTTDVKEEDALAVFSRRNRELAERRLAEGLPAYVKVDGIDGIVRQMPDGTRELVEIVDGVMQVAGRLPPEGSAGS